MIDYINIGKNIITKISIKKEESKCLIQLYERNMIF